MSYMIDSHVHIWDPSVLEYDWLSGDLDRRFMPDEYHAVAPDTNGVVFVQAGAADGLAEASWVASLEWRGLLGIVAQAPLEQGSAVRAYLEQVGAIDRVVGVRRLLQDEPLAFFEHPGLLAGLRTLGATGLTFDACVRTAQLPALVSLLSKFPELPVVLDHLGKPPVASGDDGGWERNVRELAALPQVMVKLSGIAPEASASQGVREQAKPWLDVALDAFGAQRCMIGSDWPVSATTTHAIGPREWLFDVLDELGASSAEREYLSWRSSADFYSLPLKAR